MSLGLLSRGVILRLLRDSNEVHRFSNSSSSFFYKAILLFIIGDMFAENCYVTMRWHMMTSTFRNTTRWYNFWWQHIISKLIEYSRWSQQLQADNSTCQTATEAILMDPIGDVHDVDDHESSYSLCISNLQCYECVGSCVCQ